MGVSNTFDNFELVPVTELIRKQTTEEKSFAPDAVANTIQSFPSNEEEPGLSSFLLNITTVADDIPEWGHNVTVRDKKLREFLYKENNLISAIYSVSARNASFDYVLDGPQRVVNQIQRTLFDLANLGKGWQDFILRFSIEYYTQDNGVFVELIRKENRPNSPVVGVNVLDSSRCVRTGSPEVPVIYTNREGKRFKLKWFNVVALSEFPSNIEEMYGVGYSAITRVLRAAQILRDISIYKSEKVSGRFNRAIHIVSGITSKQISDTITQSQEHANNLGLSRHIQPAVLGSVDPAANVSHVQIDLASLPDAFDEDSTFKWFMAQMALALGVDYQDLAPLPSGGLGNSQQSEILHRKSRGKGPALFMHMVEHLFNAYILPRNITFKFLDPERELEAVEARIGAVRAKNRAERINSGELTPRAARLIALEEGDMTQEIFDAIERELAEGESQQDPQGNVLDNGERRLPRADDPNPKLDIKRQEGTLDAPG